MRDVERRADIDGLRAVAVSMVVGYHLWPATAVGGFIGVDVFFVISGYLITGIILRRIDRGEFSFRGFLVGRIRRLYPALLVTIVLTFAAGAVLMSPVALQGLAAEAIAAATSTSNFLFWAQSGYFDVDASRKPLLHTWSLGVEQQFYLLWPLALLALASFNRRARPFVFGASALLGLAIAEMYLRMDSAGAFFLLAARIFEFAAGATVTQIPRLNSRIGENAVFCIGLALIGLSCGLLDRSTPFPGVSAVPVAIGAALCIWTGRSACALLILANRPAAWIGQMSYSLYLVHWPLIVMTLYVVRSPLDPSEQLLLLAAIAIGAVALHYGVEQPFRRKPPDAASISSRILMRVVAVGLASVIAPAVHAYVSGGWAWRLRENAGMMAQLGDPSAFHLRWYGGYGCAKERCETRPGSLLPVVFVIGDSHARALYSGLRAAMPEFNFVIFGPNACPLYSIDPPLNSHHPNSAVVAECTAAQALAFTELAAHAQPTILLAQLWYTYSAVLRSDVRRAVPSAPDSFAREVAAGIAGLRTKLNAEVFVVGGLPVYEASVSPMDCLGRPTGARSCLTPVSAPQTRMQARFNSRLAEIIGRGALIDPFAVLCFGDTCDTVLRDGRPVFSDDSHLSVWGSVHVVKNLRGELLRLLSTSVADRQ